MSGDRTAYHAAYYKKNRDKWPTAYAVSKETRRVRSEAYRTANPGKRLFNLARARAKEQGLPFTITEEHVIVPAVCPVLGIPLRKANRKGPSDNSPSLDRFKPELGYVPGNIQVISFLANRIKSNATVEQVEAVARWMRITSDAISH